MVDLATFTEAPGEVELEEQVVHRGVRCKVAKVAEACLGEYLICVINSAYMDINSIYKRRRLASEST